MKNDQRNPIYPSVLFSCMIKQVKLMFKAEQGIALKRPCLSLKFESLIQICSNTSGFSCISPTHSYCHVSCMHHIVAHCLVMVVYRCPLRHVLPPRSTVITLTKNHISASTHQASNQPFDHIDTIPCSRSCSLLLH